MTHARLIEELAAEIRDALKNVKMPTEYQRTPQASDFVKVNVLEQYLPVDIFENSSYLPFILVEWLSTEDDLKRGSIAEVGLTIANFAFEQDGYKDAFF